MRIVYDVSAKEREGVPSLNDSIQDHPYRIYFGVSWSEEDFVLLPSLGICRRPFRKSESGRKIEIHCDSTGDPENKLNFRRSDSHELYSGWHLRRSSARRRSYRAPSGKLGRSQTRSRTRNTKDTPQMLKRKNWETVLLGYSLTRHSSFINGTPMLRNWSPRVEFPIKMKIPTPNNTSARIRGARASSWAYLGTIRTTPCK